MAEPLISIVMPVFNAERWLPAALNSIQRQSHANIEIIAVDDGSLDASLRILSDAARADGRVKVISWPRNRGIVEALNTGVRQAQGDFIARMDADDIALPRRLEQQHRYLGERGLDLCGSWIIEFGMGLPRTSRLPVMPASIQAQLLFQTPFCHPTILARTRVFRDFPYRGEYRHAEDYDFFARASARYHMGACPRPLLKYRRSASQMTAVHQSAMQQVADRVRKDLLEARGIPFTDAELRTHNRIRAFKSMDAIEELDAVESWLFKLYELHRHPEAREVVASQWARACVRAAPLGLSVWHRYRNSELRRLFRKHRLESLDILVLAVLRLRHEGKGFQWARRVGLSG